MTDILLYFLDAITPFHLAITLAGTVVGIIIGSSARLYRYHGYCSLDPHHVYLGHYGRPDFFGRHLLWLYVWRLHLRYSD